VLVEQRCGSMHQIISFLPFIGGLFMIDLVCFFWIA